MTRVDDDPDLATYHENKLDEFYNPTTIYTQRFSWLDHLAGVFGIRRTGKIVPIIKTSHREVPEVC
jgi:hypothetical protein